MTEPEPWCWNSFCKAVEGLVRKFSSSCPSTCSELEFLFRGLPSPQFNTYKMIIKNKWPKCCELYLGNQKNISKRDSTCSELKFLFRGLKFIYSEKATKILRNLHLFLTGTTTSQKKVEISQDFCGLLRIYELYLKQGYINFYFLFKNLPSFSTKTCVLSLRRSDKQRKDGGGK